MKSLIILKGLVKRDKLSWIKNNSLQNFFLDIENFRQMYYKPEYKGGRDFLVRSHDDIVYRRFMEALIYRLNSGNLVVIDAEFDTTTGIEYLSEFFGYTIFYRIFSTPINFVKDYKKFNNPQYLSPSKESIRQMVLNLENINWTGKNIIKTVKDVDEYWNKKIKMAHFTSEAKISNISDIHSNWSLLQKILPFTEKSDLTIFYGDYIDGPEVGGSREVIDYVLSCDSSKTIFLEGNHELRLRKYLAYLYFKSNQRKIIADTLYEELSSDFLEKTVPDFNNLRNTEVLEMIENLNQKLRPFYKFSKGNYIYISSHAGIRWLEQLSPKFIGNLIYSNHNPDKTDYEFSKSYKEGYVSIHGHCKYPAGVDFLKYENVINFDTEDENTVNYFSFTENIKISDICIIRRESLE